MHTKRFLAMSLVTTMMVVLAAGAALAQDDDVMSTEEATPGPMAVSVLDAWSRPSPMADGIGVAYMRLVNTTEADDVLLGADSLAAAVVEMHQTTADDEGMMSMSPVEAIPVPAGGETMLEPGGYHLMLIELVEPLSEGATVELTLRFATAGEIDVSAEVLAMGEMPMDEMPADDMPMDEMPADDMPMDEPDASESPSDG